MLLFAGTHGGNYTGDIAIDDLKLASGTCRNPVTTSTLAPTTLGPRVDRFVCNFERDICAFTQVHLMSICNVMQCNIMMTER